MNNDDRLFQACMIFCENYAQLLSKGWERERIKKHWQDDEIVRMEFDMLTKRVRHSVRNIKEIIEEIDTGVKK